MLSMVMIGLSSYPVDFSGKSVSTESIRPVTGARGMVHYVP